MYQNWVIMGHKSPINPAALHHLQGQRCGSLNSLLNKSPMGLNAHLSLNEFALYASCGATSHQLI